MKKIEHKHDFTDKIYIKQAFGAKIFPNAIYGTLIAICKKCGEEEE